MPIRIDGDNATATPGITGGDADTGFVFGTDQIEAVTGGTTRFTVESGGNVTIENGNLVLASGSGIDFSATADPGTSTESELFNDYEHGRWTPTVIQGATSITHSRAYYIKTGDTVNISAAVTLTTPNASAFQIGGLPYAPNNSIQMGPSAGIKGYETTGSVMVDSPVLPASAFMITAYLFGGSSSAQFYWSRSSGGWAQASGTQIGGTVIFSLTYLVA